MFAACSSLRKRWYILAMMYLSLLLALICLLLTTSAQSNTSTFAPARPPSIPLAVKNPYLNVWLPAGNTANGGYLPGQWPSFWT
jgi:hypothetical protein